MPVKRESTGKNSFKTIFSGEDCPEEDVGVLKGRDNPTPTTALPTTVLANNNIIHVINNNTKINQQHYSGTLNTNCTHICRPVQWKLAV